MREGIDVDLFLLALAKHMCGVSNIKNNMTALYKKEKNRFYTKAKSHKYYNCNMIKRSSMETEIFAKRAFGVLLCAEEDEKLRNDVFQIIIVNKPRLKFLLNGYSVTELASYIENEINNANYTTDENMFSTFAVIYFLIYKNDIESDYFIDKLYDAVKDLLDAYAKINTSVAKEDIYNVSYNKYIEFDNYVRDIMSTIDKYKALQLIGNIRGYKFEDWGSEADSLISDYFYTAESFLDVSKASSYCVLLENMLIAEGLEFDYLYNEEDITKRDKEYIYKLLAQTNDTVTEFTNGRFKIKKGKYKVDFTDIVVAFLFKCLIHTLLEDRKYYFANHTEAQFLDSETDVSFADSKELLRFQEENKKLKEENEKLKKEIEALKHSLTQKDKNLDAAVRAEGEKYKEEIDEKNSLIEIFQEQLVGFAELYYILDTANRYLGTIVKENVDESEFVLPYNLEELQQKRMLIIGGRIEKIQELKKILPKSVFISNETDKVPDTQFDLIFFFNNFLSHALFFKYVKKAREEGINVGYCIHTNIEMALSDMYEGLKGSKNLLDLEK